MNPKSRSNSASDPAAVGSTVVAGRSCADPTEQTEQTDQRAGHTRDTSRELTSSSSARLSESSVPQMPRVRRGLSVALIGADGAGKTTVARRLANEMSAPISYIYMGSNLEAGNWMLPTTWAVRQWRRWRGRQGEGGGPPTRDRTGENAGSGGKSWKRPLRFLKSSLSLGHRLMEQSFRHLVAWSLRRMGRIIVFDRHYYTDYYAFDVDQTAHRSMLQRVHGFLLQHFFSKPDLVIFLDAPSEVLFARKGEGTIELLEHRRQDYLKVRREFEHFYIVDVRQPIDQVTEEVAHRLASFIQNGT